MKFPRASGILLHPTSLPGRFGMGDLGPDAYQFADFLAETGQHIWQVLPLGPTGYGDSPYQCFSAAAGNPMLLSPEKLAEAGLLEARDLADVPAFPADQCAFEQVIPFKTALLRKAFARFRPGGEFDNFIEKQRAWLDSYATFAALKEGNGGRSWTEWRAQEPDAREVQFHKFVQWEFFRQWGSLKLYCAARGIRIFGDIPIYMAHDSADVWSHRDLFELDEHGRPLRVAGVPPDYFSATGQLWGNPLYRWHRLAETGYAWWIDRLRWTLLLVDMIRVDHFRGFEAYWAVPAGEKTAQNGQWIKGPGARFFQSAQEALGELPLVAENLGVITPEVEAIRHQFGFPGMSVLQFAFGKDAQAPTFRPHNYPREIAAYTGTHDNDTTAGWWNSAAQTGSTRSAADIGIEREFAKAYLNTDGAVIQWDFIRAVWASVADTAISPMQDVLGLGTEARMNLSASTSGNWRWRFQWEQLTPDLRERLKTLTVLYGR